MRLLLLCGFLGSGKTTILMELLYRLKKTYRQIVIIENEIGEAGVDGRYLSENGLKVRELFGGCICCTLSSGLVATVNNIEEIYNPDLVVVEATGVARPDAIVSTINLNLMSVKTIKTLTVIDAYRYKILLEMMKPLVVEQISAADVIAINKIDEVGKEELKLIFESVHKINSRAKVVSVSAKKQINIGLLVKEI